MLAESALLTALGTIAGVALAWAGIRQLQAIAPANLPRLEMIRIDPIVLLFTAGSALAAAFLFGMVPAWSAFRMDLMGALGGAARTAGLRGGGRLFRNAIVVLEVALCFVLLVGSGLMFRSFLELQRIDPGFDPRGLLTFQLLGGRPGPPEQRQTAGNQLADRFRAIPGVESVTASFPFPLSGNFSTIRWGLEEALADNSKYQAVDWQLVRPGYFEAMKTPLLFGRTFTEADNDPKRNLVVVDPILAAKAFPNQPAVGKRILIRIRTAEPEWVEIIGVVGHQRVTSLADPGREQVYFAEGFLGFGANRWAIRTSGDPSQIAGAVRAAVASVDPTYLVTDVEPMDGSSGRRRRARASRSCSSACSRHGGAARVGGALRRAVDRRPPAHGRNRRPHGARRLARPHPPFRRRPRPAPQRGRHRARLPRRPRAHARDDDDAGRREAERSADVRGDGRGVLCDRGALIVAARAPRRGAGPDDGSPRRIAVRGFSA